ADLSRSAKKLKEFAVMIDSLAEAAETVPLHELYEQMLSQSGYVAALEAFGEEGVDRLDNVNEFLSTIRVYEIETDEPTLTGFMQEVSLISDMDVDDGDGDRVWLMTMHTAKGLEFPVVFLVGMEEGVFPGNQSIYGTQQDMEEERRLAYVGITRAKDQLYLTRAAMRMLFGRTERHSPSRFLNEIPEDLIRKESSPELAGAFRSFIAREPAARAPRFVDYDAPAMPPVAKPIPQRKQPAPSKTAPLSVGDRIRHPVFAEGTVLKVIPMGNDVMLEIAFDSVGTKKLMGNYARVEKIG
ncbi:MAG: ATP-binding domain-containing protein, partial [Clostridia bacterium]|nr:ATP-binding domain-containing protein [Clostridia bacterium]